MSEPTRIDICICTFRRAHVANTLASLSIIEMPFNSSLRIIVADNDEVPSAQVMVAQAAEQHGLNVTYIHAPARNISIARNACLDAVDADFFAFVDDDEAVTPQWLLNITNKQKDSQADIVLGPVLAVYDARSPKWLLDGDYHSTRPVWVKNRIITGYCGNVLMRAASPALAGLRFREDLGITGGEDTDFFSRAHEKGATIDYAENASIYEGVPPERANFSWLKRRKFRYGQTHAMQLIEAGKPRLKNTIKAGIKAALCFFMVIWSPFSGRKWILRGMLHCGVVSGLRRAD